MDEHEEVAQQILEAIEGLRSELAFRDKQDAVRTAAMEDLREELRKERIRRQFLWTPIGILASILTVITLMFVDARAEDRAQERQVCEQSNAARATIREFIDAMSEDMDPASAARLDELADENLSQKPCD